MQNKMIFVTKWQKKSGGGTPSFSICNNILVFTQGTSTFLDQVPNISPPL
jgi:hypothetical protein